VLAALAVARAAPALATWVQSNSVSQAISSAALASPTGLSADRGSCTPAVSDTANLGWTATTSTFADGYEVFRGTASGGPYSQIATVSGRTTTTYSDATVAFSTTYYYIVQAKYLQWRSADAGQASVTTPNVLCV
jgi:hypothetical protein